jgi:hypothetical protein
MTALSDALFFSILLILCIAVVLAVIYFGSILFKIPPSDPDFGKLTPMVPVLIPMAFTGELVYRMTHFAEGIGDFIPTIGRQFYLSFLEYFSFGVPDFPVQVLAAFFMMNGAIAGGYILWRYALGEFEGVLELKNFAGLHFLLGGILFIFLWVIF